MTPQSKTRLKDKAQCRALVNFSSPAETTHRLPASCYVEGYAALYEPYVLYEDPEGPVYERFEPGCFDGADMDDVIMQYDHAGKVLARTANHTLLVEADEHGLFFAADLGRTGGARSLYEDIQTGMVTKMSWRFRPGDYHYEAGSRTLVHTRIAKVYDVSAVSIPANDMTEIHARAWADGEIVQAARSEAALEQRRRKLRLKIETITGG